jgi:hypothetical protein
MIVKFIFVFSDKNQNGFIDFTGFIILAYQLINGKLKSSLIEENISFPYKLINVHE